MQLALSTEERDTCRHALGRIKRVTEAAQKAYEKATLATIAADSQLGHIDTASHAVETTKEADDVAFTHPQRLAVLAGIALTMEDVDQTKSRELHLGIGTEGSEERTDALKRLARRLGDQKELPLTSEKLDLAGVAG